MTPPSGTGKDVAGEVVDLVREKNIPLEALGCDGTPVNTGIHKGTQFWCGSTLNFNPGFLGALCEIEKGLGIECQHCVCLLHCNELFFRHRMCELDGSTQGPEAFSGPVGSTATMDVWKEKIVAFSKIPGKVPVIPEDVVTTLSRDQKLLYKLGMAVQTGDFPDNLPGAAIGPCCHARWLTCACRLLRMYMSTSKPSKTLKKLVFIILNHYIPCWFRIKMNPHCQSGAENFFYMVELGRDLPISDQATLHRVLQTNSFWGHAENLLIGMLADSRNVIREKAVLSILAARRKYDQEAHPRKFLPPQLNFAATLYVDLINWEEEQATEPPITMKLSEEEILSARLRPLRLPAYPCHTQSVEHAIPLVTEACLHRAGYCGRHSWIISTAESRQICPKFNTKKNDGSID